MPLDNFIDQARELRRQGCSVDEVFEMLRKYGATADEADRVLRELQKEERRKHNPNDF